MDVHAKSLLEWAQSLPHHPNTEDDVILALVSDAEENPDSFVDFLLTLASEVDFRKISSVQFLFSLCFISFEHPNTHDTSRKALEMFANVCAQPNLFDETYNTPRLVYDLVGFILFQRYSDEWIAMLAECLVSPEAEAVIEKAMFMLAERVASETIDRCLMYLSVFERWIHPPQVRKAVCESERFVELLFLLFSQSWFATDSVEQSEMFFGKSPTDLTLPMVESLDRAFEPYVTKLASLLRAFLHASSREWTLKAIPSLLEKMEKISTSGFMYTSANSTPKVEAFALNFEAALVKLAILNSANVSGIDAHSPYLTNSLTPFRAEQLTLSPVSDEQEQAWAAEVEEANKNPASYISMFFFAAAQSIEYGSRALDRLVVQIRRNGDALARNTNPMLMMLINQMKSAMKYSEFAIETGILRQGKINDFLVFADMVLDFLLKEAGISGESVPDTPSNSFAHIPQYVFTSVIALLTDYLHARKIPNPLKYMSKLVMLFHNEKYLHYDSCRASIVRLFSFVASSSQYKHLVVGIRNILPLMFPAVLKFYCSVQVTGQNSTLYDKIQYRIDCTDLLIVWLMFPEFKAYFRDHMSDEFITKFVFYLVDDTMYFTDQCISLLKTIHESTEEQDHNDNPELQAEIAGEISLSRSNLGYWMMHTNKAIDLMVSIVRFCPESFHENIVLDTMTKMILSIMDLYANHREYFSMPDRESLGLNPSALLKSLVTIIIAVAPDAEILGQMVGNAMFPAVTLGQALLPVVSRTVPEKQHEYEKFIAMAQELKALQESQVIDTSDAPDEFLDGLMFELMDEPMKLPSGFYMDKKNLEKALLSKPLDPFTQVPLKLEDCVLDEDLKKQIDEYKAKKRSAK